MLDKSMLNLLLNIKEAQGGEGTNFEGDITAQNKFLLKATSSIPF